jgi:uncharacterized protein (TIGR03435 family)
MVRGLLEDRFSLKTHIEQRAVPAWALTAAKPRLRNGDPTNRTSCKEGPDPGEKDLRQTNPGISRLVTCHNMTMAQFAEQLPNIANVQAALCCLYLRSPVLDSTALEGAYDFTFGFSFASAIQNNSVSSDPDGAVSLFEALNSQLGLKLSLEKRTAPVLVIDRVEPKPTEN